MEPPPDPGSAVQYRAFVAADFQQVIDDALDHLVDVCGNVMDHVFVYQAQGRYGA
jgi:hypothetical protein